MDQRSERRQYLVSFVLISMILMEKLISNIIKSAPNYYSLFLIWFQMEILNKSGEYNCEQIITLLFPVIPFS